MSNDSKNDNVTDLTAVRRTIDAGRALLHLDPDTLKRRPMCLEHLDPGSLLAAAVNSMRDVKPVALMFHLELLATVLDDFDVNTLPLRRFAEAFKERTPGEHAAAFAALPEAADFGGYLIDAVHRATGKELH